MSAVGMLLTGTSNATTWHRDGEQEYRCRHGHIHEGVYRIEDWVKCQCDHYEDLWLIDSDYAICSGCAQAFTVRANTKD